MIFCLLKSYYLCLVQEFMILPVGASSFKEAMKMGVEVYHNLKVALVLLVPVCNNKMALTVVLTLFLIVCVSRL